MTFDTTCERSHAPNTMNTENEKAPKRIWVNNPAEVTEHDQRWWYGNEMAFPTVEYVRADLLVTARKEAREAAFREAVNWAKKVHGVKVNAANDAAADDEFAAMRLGHEADGVQRVIDTLEAALERAATDTDKTERG